MKNLAETTDKWGLKSYGNVAKEIEKQHSEGEKRKKEVVQEECTEFILDTGFIFIYLEISGHSTLTTPKPYSMAAIVYPLCSKVKDKSPLKKILVSLMLKCQV